MKDASEKSGATASAYFGGCHRTESSEVNGPTFKTTDQGPQLITLPDMVKDIQNNRENGAEKNEGSIPAMYPRKLGKRRMDSTSEIELSNEHTSLEQSTDDAICTMGMPKGRRYNTRGMQYMEARSSFIERLVEKYAVPRKQVSTSPTAMEEVGDVLKHMGCSPQNSSDHSNLLQPPISTLKEIDEAASPDANDTENSCSQNKPNQTSKVTASETSSTETPKNMAMLSSALKSSGSENVMRRLTRSSVRLNMSKVTSCNGDQVAREKNVGRKMGVCSSHDTKAETITKIQELGGESSVNLNVFPVDLYSAPLEMRLIDKHLPMTEAILISPEALVHTDYESLYSSPMHKGHKRSSECLSKEVFSTAGEGTQVSSTFLDNGENVGECGVISVSSTISEKKPSTDDVVESAAGICDNKDSMLFGDGVTENRESLVRSLSELPLSSLQAKQPPSSTQLPISSPSIPKTTSIPLNQGMLETAPITSTHMLSVVTSSTVLCPQSFGEISYPLQESVLVESTLSRKDHTMFNSDSDIIISLLDEVPNTVTCVCCTETVDCVVNHASGSCQEVEDVSTGVQQYTIDVSVKQETGDVLSVIHNERCADSVELESKLKQVIDKNSHLDQVLEDKPTSGSLGDMDKVIVDAVSKYSNARCEANLEVQPANVIGERRSMVTTREQVKESEIGGGTQEMELECVCDVGEVLTCLFVCEGSSEKAVEEGGVKVDGNASVLRECKGKVPETKGDNLMEKEEAMSSCECVKIGEIGSVKDWMEGVGNEAGKVVKEGCAYFAKVKGYENLSAEDITMGSKKAQVTESQHVLPSGVLRYRSNTAKYKPYCANAATLKEPTPSKRTVPTAKTTAIEMIEPTFQYVLPHHVRLRARSTSEEGVEMMALSPTKKLHVDTGTTMGKRSRLRTSSKSEPKEKKSEEVMAPRKIAAMDPFACIQGNDIVSSISPSCDAKALTKKTCIEIPANMAHDDMVNLDHQITHLDDKTLLTKDNVESVVLLSTKKLEVSETLTWKSIGNKDALLCDPTLSLNMKSLLETKPTIVNALSINESVEDKEVKSSAGGKGKVVGCNSRIALRGSTRSIPILVEEHDSELLKCSVMSVDQTCGESVENNFVDGMGCGLFAMELGLGHGMKAGAPTGNFMELSDNTSTKKEEPSQVTGHPKSDTIQQRQPQPNNSCVPPLLHMWEGECIVVCGTLILYCVNLIVIDVCQPECRCSCTQEQL